MRKTIVKLAVLLFIVASCQTKNEKPSENQLLLATAWYQQSAEMRACYYQSYLMARLALAENLKNYTGSKPTAVVLDIDETVLDNSPYEAHLVANGCPFTNNDWKLWTDRSEGLPLPGAAEFINFARQQGVDVFFISNRKIDERQSTLRNLEQAGMAVDSAHLLTREPSKSSCKDDRRNLVAANYEILLFVGDNLCDYSSLFEKRDQSLALALADSMQADFGTRCIILPNPMYGEWENAIYDYKYDATRSEKNQMILNRLRQ